MAVIHIRLNGLPRASGNEISYGGQVLSQPAIRAVSEYVRQSRSSVEKDQHMYVCTEWVHKGTCIKPGGTAGRIYIEISDMRIQILSQQEKLGQDFLILTSLVLMNLQSPARTGMTDPLPQSLGESSRRGAGTLAAAML